MNRNKKTVRLTESELRNFIKEAVAVVLRENEVMSNITEGEVLNIINTAIAENNFEITDDDIYCTNRKSYGSSYKGEIIIGFYSDNMDVYVTASCEADYTPGAEDTYWEPGCSEECSGGINSVDKVEIRTRDKNFIPVDIPGITEKIYQIITTDQLEEKWNDEIFGMVQREMEDYGAYLDGERERYYDSLEDR